MKQNLKKIIATSSLVTTMVLVNAGVTAAQYIPDISASDMRESTKQSYRHEKRFEDKLSFLAVKAGIDPELLERADSRRTIKQLLKSHGITEQEIQQALGNYRSKHTK